MIILASIATIILGLAIGSFLNVLICRLPKGESIWKRARSHCPKCQNVLGFFELIPVLSFVWLKGLCRHCKAKISWQYPIVEIVTAILFEIILLLHWEQLVIGFDYLSLVKDFLFVSVLLVIMVIDWKEFAIIDSLIYIMLPIAFFLNLMVTGFTWFQVANMLAAGGVGFLFYYFQYAISKGRWVGDGDMLLGALIGIMVGWTGLVFTIFVAYIVGAIVAIVLLAIKWKQFGGALPMAVFLCPATMIFVLFNQQIIEFLRLVLII